MDYQIIETSLLILNNKLLQLHSPNLSYHSFKTSASASPTIPGYNAGSICLIYTRICTVDYHNDMILIRSNLELKSIYEIRIM